MVLSYSRRLWLLEAAPILLMALLFIKTLEVSKAFDQPWRINSALESATLSLVAVTAVPLLLTKRVVRFAGAMSVNLAITFLLAADLVHFSFYRELISVAELENAWQIGSVGSSVLRRLDATVLGLFLDVAVAIIVFPFYARASRRLPEMSWTMRRTWSIGSLVLALLAALPSLWLSYRDPDAVLLTRYSTVQSIEVMGIVPYHLLDLGHHVASFWMDRALTPAEREDVDRLIESRHRVPERRSPLFGAAKGRNLILIQAESLQAFPIGLRVGGQAVTPHLNAFAGESLQFENFHEQTALGATSDAIFVALQSLLPLPPEDGVVATRYRGNKYAGLPAVLGRHGYLTFAAMGAPGGYWNIQGLEQRLGFQQSYFDDFFVGAQRFGQGVADEAFFRLSQPLLTGAPEPFMAFLVSVSNHDPYVLPDRVSTFGAHAVMPARTGLYLDSVHYFDRAFGALVDGLRSTGLLDRSIVAVYGDHQGWLGDPPEVAQLLGFPESSAYDHWKTRKRVPLFIRLPGGQHAGRIPTVGGQLDISPTLMSLLGIPREGVAMLGADLTENRDALVVFRDGSFATNDHYLINDIAPSKYFNIRPETRGPLCYERSSGEQVDCTALQPQQREALHQLRTSDLILSANLVADITSKLETK